jgi:hypothetical protein
MKQAKKRDDFQSNLHHIKKANKVGAHTNHEERAYQLM